MHPIVCGLEIAACSPGARAGQENRLALVRAEYAARENRRRAARKRKAATARGVAAAPACSDDPAAGHLQGSPILTDAEVGGIPDLDLFQSQVVPSAVYGALDLGDGLAADDVGRTCDIDALIVDAGMEDDAHLHRLQGLGVLQGPGYRPEGAGFAAVPFVSRFGRHVVGHHRRTQRLDIGGGEIAFRAYGRVNDSDIRRAPARHDLNFRIR